MGRRGSSGHARRLLLRSLLDVGCELALDVSCPSVVANGIGDRLQLRIVEYELALLVFKVGVGALSLVATELSGSFPNDLCTIYEQSVKALEV